MAQEQKQAIVIKGTRDGLSLIINEEASFEDILLEISEKVAGNAPLKDEPVLSVTVKLGHRYLNETQRELLCRQVQQDERFHVTAMESEVVSREEAQAWLDESEVKVHHGIVRSGQVLEVNGDLLLVGEVNPGATVKASGNIYILGQLNGIAHAGWNGDSHAVIVASYMKPTQLRIADYISRAPDHETEGIYMECGAVDEKQDKIVIDPLKSLLHKRKGFSGFERRMNRE